MTVKVDKRSRWYSESLQPNEGPPRDFDLFAPIDSRGTGLRSFVEQELNTRAINRSGGNETLGKGVFLRITVNNEFELTVARGRGCYDCYICQSREEALALAAELQIQKGR